MTAVPLKSAAKSNMFDSIARSIFPSRRAAGEKLITLSHAAKGLYLIHCCDPIAGLIGAESQTRRKVASDWNGGGIAAIDHPLLASTHCSGFRCVFPLRNPPRSAMHISAEYNAGPPVICQSFPVYITPQQHIQLAGSNSRLTYYRSGYRRKPSMRLSAFSAPDTIANSPPLRFNVLGPIIKPL
jgi:hypothetical protein